MGKTSIAALLAETWAQRGLRVYAVDADPDANLGWALGFSDEELESIPPLSELGDLIEERAGKGGIFVLNPDVDDVIPRYSGQKHGVHLLRMGSLKPGGAGCYCPENAFLRSVVGTLLVKKGDAVILDMGAGVEHLTRGTTRHVDLLLVVVEPSRASIGTARTVEKLARDLGLGNVKIVGNKVDGPGDEEFIRGQFADEQVLGCLPHDSDFQRAGRDGVPGEGPFLRAVSDLGNLILEEGTAV